MDFTAIINGLLISMPVLILSLSVHETAHAVSALYFGDTTARDLGRITLNPVAHVDIIGTLIIPIVAVLSFGFAMIGWAKPVPVNLLNLGNYRRDYSLVALAGPVSNILLSFVFLLAAVILLATGVAHGEEGVGTFLYKLVDYGIRINVALAVFNMLPIPPLDGSHILEYFLPLKVAESYSRIGAYGFFILIFLINIPIFNSLLSLIISTVMQPYNFVLLHFF